MWNFLRDNRRLVLLLLGLGLGLRLYFIILFPHEGGDSIIYSALARNLVQAHVYSANDAPPLLPNFIRTPGYPIFIAAIYRVFGLGNDTAVRVAQALLDCVTCLIIGGIALCVAQPERRRSSAVWALTIASLCPFVANYTASILSETLAVFCSAFAIFAFLRALKDRDFRWWVACALACGCAVMVRPDSGLLVIAIAITLTGVRFANKQLGLLMREGGLFTLVFVVALAPWSIRNAVLFHAFQPLNPFYAQSPGEFVPTGYYRWVRTWIADSKYMDPAIWAMNDQPTNIDNYPPAAFDTAEEREEVSLLLDQYNEDLDLSAELDAQFRVIAGQRIARSPFRFYVTLPLLRAANLWFKPRSEILPLEPEIFPVRERLLDSPIDFSVAVLFEGIQWILIFFAVLGLALARRDRTWLALFVLSVVIRTSFLSRLEGPEPRYVLELFPLLLVAAGGGLSWLAPRARRFFRPAESPAG